MGTHYGPENSGPVRRFGEGGGSADGLLSLPDANLHNALWVDKTSIGYAADGSVQYPYNSIDDAVDAAAALLPTASNPVAIIVAPGEYTESVELDTDYVYLYGWNRESTILKNGGGGANPLIVTTEHTAVSGITIEAMDTTVRAVEIDTGSLLIPVRFMECAALVATPPNGGDGSVYVHGDSFVEWIDCDFLSSFDTVKVYQQVTQPGDRSHFFACRATGYFDFDNGSWTFRGCEIDGYIDNVAGGDVQLLDTRVTTTSGSAVRGIPGGAEVRDCILTSQAGNYDIFNAGGAAQVYVENVVMNTLGLNININKYGTRRFIGAAGNADFYNSFVECMSVMSNNPHTIELLKDVTVTTQIVCNFTGPVTIKGNGHTVTRAGGAAVIFASGWMRFVDVNLVGEIQVAGGAATVELLEGCRLDGRIDCYWGAASRVILDGATVVGDAVTGHCLRLRDQHDDITVTIKRSYLKGAAGFPAVYWDSGYASNILYIKYSTLWHGDGAANNPFARNAAQTPDYRSHHSRYNMDPQTGAIWTNLVAAAQRFDSYDVQTDY